MPTATALAPVSELGFVEVRTRDVQAIVDHYTRVLSFEATEQDGATTYLTVGPDHHCVIVSEGEPTGRASIGLTLLGSIDDAAQALRGAGVETARRADPQPGIAASLTIAEAGTGTPIHLYERMAVVDVPAIHGLRPTKLGHVASFAPSVVDIQKFYLDVLGFRWSDQVGDFFIFLRCNSDHHAVNFLGSTKNVGLHHTAFEARDIVHLKDILDTLAKHDVRLQWGPGRHGPGHNIFSYHADPDGNRIEVFTEIDRILDERDPHWEPRPWHEEFPMGPKEWPLEPQTANQWGPMDVEQLDH
jgi:catechol-2,3-dioxygenase